MDTKNNQLDFTITLLESIPRHREGGGHREHHAEIEKQL